MKKTDEEKKEEEKEDGQKKRMTNVQAVGQKTKTEPAPHFFPKSEWMVFRRVLKILNL